MLKESEVKQVIFLICGIDGWTVNITNINSNTDFLPFILKFVLYFFETTKRIQGNYVANEWSELGLDGWTVNIDSVYKFKYRFPTVTFILHFFESLRRIQDDYITDEWNELGYDRVVSKQYDVAKLLKVAAGNAKDVRYERLLALWRKCLEERGWLSNAVIQRRKTDACIHGRNI